MDAPPSMMRLAIATVRGGRRRNLAASEVMRGSIVDYRPNGRGFFIEPPNTRGNNIQVYAMSAAIGRLRFV